MSFELQQIMKLIEQGMTHQQIAKKLQTTVGKVRYQLYKKRQQETKQDLRPIHSEQPAVQVRAEIEDCEVHPWHGEDRLVILPHSPEILYVYWEITYERKRLVEEHFGCGWDVLPKILRVYDVTDILFNGDNSHRFIDIQVNDYANNWFIPSLNDNRNYCVDYGTFTWDGRYFSILRSDAVHLPPSEGQPWREHEKWTKEKTETEEPAWAEEFTGYSIQKA
ncbi:DUF4912 domain-containing protein [Ammoniphilus sp. 3BR4]|uniref:DUF4912 domain-containing protein n=1 Tax=Ammoniphilus sp. 3BR4 TaxID=3158265 RepID=UPI0034656D65